MTGMKTFRFEVCPESLQSRSRVVNCPITLNSDHFDGFALLGIYHVLARHILRSVLVFLESEFAYGPQRWARSDHRNGRWRFSS